MNLSKCRTETNSSALTLQWGKRTCMGVSISVPSVAIKKAYCDAARPMRVTVIGGGCPEGTIGPRIAVVSVLTTSQKLTCHC